LEKDNLIDILLVNSQPVKTETGELVLPCFTHCGHKLLSAITEPHGVRPVLVRENFHTSQNKLQILTDHNPHLNSFIETFGFVESSPKQ